MGYSIEEAKTAEGKRKAQKYENPKILEKALEEKMTFRELTAWYLNLIPVKKLRSFPRVQQCLSNFIAAFGDLTISKIKPLDLEEYQARREEKGAAPATIDMELSIAKTMVNKAFDNEIASGHTLKVFRSYKRKLKKGNNVRKRTLTFEEFTRLISVSSQHLKAILTVAFNTGMRIGEIRTLQWNHVDRKKGVIRLPAELTKEGKVKAIPMNHHVIDALDSLPRAIHHDFVFTYRGKPITERGGLKRSFATACKGAEIPCGRKETEGITLHDIRRTVKTNMAAAGVDKVYRDTILGHSLQGMDAHYMMPSEDDLHRAMDRYTQWLDFHLDSASVDQNVDQTKKEARLNLLTP